MTPKLEGSAYTVINPVYILKWNAKSLTENANSLTEIFWRFRWPIFSLFYCARGLNFVWWCRISSISSHLCLLGAGGFEDISSTVNLTNQNMSPILWILLWLALTKSSSTCINLHCLVMFAQRCHPYRWQMSTTLCFVIICNCSQGLFLP